MDELKDILELMKREEALLNLLDEDDRLLLEQQKDLSLAIDQLLEDIEAGRKYMKVYRQMKMYNDPATNPILYNQK